MFGQLMVTNLEIDQKAGSKQIFFSIHPNSEAVFEQNITDVRKPPG